MKITLWMGRIPLETRCFRKEHVSLKGYLQGLVLDMLEHNEEHLALGWGDARFEVIATSLAHKCLN